MFALFDKLCLLSGGKTLFFGAASQALPMFEAAGVPCPKNRNPSDHFLRAINRDFEEVRVTNERINLDSYLTFQNVILFVLQLS